MVTPGNERVKLAADTGAGHSELPELMENQEQCRRSLDRVVEY